MSGDPDYIVLDSSPTGEVRAYVLSEGRVRIEVWTRDMDQTIEVSAARLEALAQLAAARGGGTPQGTPGTPR